MLTSAETVVFWVFLAIVFVGALNWGILAICKKDLIALMVNAAKKSGGAATQNNVVLLKTNRAAAIVPRVVYGLVFVSMLIVVVLILKSVATNDESGSAGSVIPAL